jgi:chemotaxis signal transduction protein
MADEDFWNYARVYANAVPPISPEKSNYQDQHLECKLSRATFLIPLKEVIEVLPSPQQYTYLPFAPTWLRGLIPWRGETIALVELDTYLNGESTFHSNGLLIIVRYNDATVGLLVPEIGLTTTVQFEQVHPFPGPSVFYTPIRAGVIRGVYAEEPVSDVSALLSDVVQQIGMRTDG